MSAERRCAVAHRRGTMANLDDEQAELLAALHAFTLLNGLGRGKSFSP